MYESELKNIREIFEKAKGGDRDAFSIIYEAYFKPLYRYVYLRIGNKAESDDLIQDIFIKAYNLPADSVSDNISALVYFYSIARRKVSDWKRKRRATVSIDENVDDYFGAMISNGELLKKDEFEKLHKAMKELTDEEQDAVIFRFSEGLSIKEVAKMMGKTESVIIRLQSDGIRLIRDILKKQYE